MKVSIQRVRNNGKMVWMVCWQPPGAKRNRVTAKTKEAAEALAADVRRKSESDGTAWSGMSAKDRSDLITVWAEVRDAGLTLREVWEGFRRQKQTVKPKPLEEAVTACVADRVRLRRRPAYTAALEYTLRRFARGRERLPVSDVTLDHVRAFLDTCQSDSVRASFQSRVSTLCAFSVSQGWLASNPVDRLGKVSVEQRAPVILTPDQVDAALTWSESHRDFRPYLVLGLFCGIRPDELTRLEWSSVDLTRGLVTIDASTSKVRRRRIVPIAPRALQILAKTPGAGRIWDGTQITLRRRRRALAAHLGMPWQADLLRHTAASYMMARDRDAGRVADALGNSPSVLLTRYRELVRPEDADRFWAPKV